MVEFVSANPTGPLSVGHGRQAILGDSIARLLEATGHDVFREYYYNNAGRQMRVLGQSLQARYLEKLGLEGNFPEDGYQGEYIHDIAAELVEEAGDSLKECEDVAPFKKKAAYAVAVETSVYLHPDAAGQGLGERLYRALLSALEPTEVLGAYAIIALPNPRSIRLHERLGFRRVGTLTDVGKKFGRLVSVAYFELRL